MSVKAVVGQATSGHRIFPGNPGQSGIQGRLQSETAICFLFPFEWSRILVVMVVYFLQSSPPLQVKYL
jgi:hypothetical protein